jgi:hypothetical protein
MAINDNKIEKALIEKIRVYLDAVHFLGACGEYCQQKFEHVQKILTKANLALEGEKRRKILESVGRLRVDQYGVGPWDQVKLQQLGTYVAAIVVFTGMLRGGSPNAQRFLSWLIAQVRRIERGNRDLAAVLKPFRESLTEHVRRR